MTEATENSSQVKWNGDTPSENSPQSVIEINEEVSDADCTPSYHREEPHFEDLSTDGNKEKNEEVQGNKMLNQSMDETTLKENPEENLFIVHKAITDLSLQETSAGEMTFREGHQWEKIPFSGNNQELSQPTGMIAEQLLEGKGNEARENKTHQATEIEWLGFQKSTQVDVLHSPPEEEQEFWDEEINNDDGDCNDDEDEVRVIEFKKKVEEYSQVKEGGDSSEDSPLSSPSSQPVTPDEHPAFGKKSDISRNSYSRYNTISYRKIRKGNTKQRIDEFESMMNL